MHLLDELETLEGYRQRFWDATLWSPYGLEACQRAGLPALNAGAAGIQGTCPTVIVRGHDDQRWVVKFYGRLFDGAQAFAVERDAARLLALDPRIQAAPLLAEGALFAKDQDRNRTRPAWDWPYLIFGFVPGQSAGRGMANIPMADRAPAARSLGEQVRRIHRLPLEGSAVFADGLQSYAQFLASQRTGATERQRAWGSLPARLADQMEGFLLPTADLLATGRPLHLIHADLTGDHLLGETRDGIWQACGLIDFGDAMAGSLAYELGALRMDLLAAPDEDEARALLAAFLDGYGLPKRARAGLPRRALSAALLHNFDLFAGCQAAQQARSLEELAARLYEA
jgi:Ser/Thr protein kinase RdoA (MazF antagonist)